MLQQNDGAQILDSSIASLPHRYPLHHLANRSGRHNSLIPSVVKASKIPVDDLQLFATNISRTELLKLGNFQNECF